MRLSCLHHHLAFDATSRRYWLAEEFGHRLLLLTDHEAWPITCPFPLQYPAGVAFAGTTLGLCSPWQGWAALLEAGPDPGSRQPKLVAKTLMTREQGLLTPKEWRWQEKEKAWWLLDSTAGKLIRHSTAQEQRGREQLDCPGLFPHSFLVAEDTFWILDQRGVYAMDPKGRCSPCLHVPHPGLCRFLGKSASGLCLLDACSRRLLLVEEDCSSWWPAMELPSVQALCLSEEGLAGLMSLHPTPRMERWSLAARSPSRLNLRELEEGLRRMEHQHLIQLGPLLAGSPSQTPAFTQTGHLRVEDLLAQAKLSLPLLSAEEKADAARGNAREWQHSARGLLADLQNNSQALNQMEEHAAMLWARECLQHHLQPGTALRLSLDDAREVRETRLTLETAILCQVLGPQGPDSHDQGDSPLGHGEGSPQALQAESGAHAQNRTRIHSRSRSRSRSRIQEIVHGHVASLLLERLAPSSPFNPARDRDATNALQMAAALGCPQHVAPLLELLEPLSAEQPRSIGHALAEFHAQTGQYPCAAAALAGADRLVEWALAAASRMSERTPEAQSASSPPPAQPLLNPRLAHEPFYHFWLGWLLLQQHRFLESAQEFARQRRLSPQSGKVASLHVLSLLLEGQLQAAAQALEHHPQPEMADLLTVLHTLLDQGAVEALALAETKKGQMQMGLLACLCARLAGMPKLALNRILEEDARQPHWNLLIQADLCRLQLGESLDEGATKRNLPAYAWIWWQGRRLYASSNQAFADALAQWAAQEKPLFAENPTGTLLALHWRPVADLPLWW